MKDRNYRTFSGFCNNIATDSKLGRRATQLKRLLKPDYHDGVGEPRSVSASNNAAPLPNPRLVSTIVHSSPNSDLQDYKHSVALMQWGQFLDHDITLTPMWRQADGSLHDCKSCKANKEFCNPIPVPFNDPHFPSRDPLTNESKCLEFVRSQSVTFFWREQLNLVTAWIDSSHVYGSFKCQSDHLRYYCCFLTARQKTEGPDQ